MKIDIKHILLGTIIVFLFLPLIQENFNVPKIEPLAGKYVPAEDTIFSRYAWFSKRFQEKKEKFLQDHFGFHNTYIRLYNQIAFNLFRKAKANNVIIGKENYLYGDRYIAAYYGEDFVGFDSIRKKMEMVSFLADTFKKMDKTFFLVFAPGKAAYYPEYLPRSQKIPKGVTNMEVYLKLAKEMNIPHLDFHSWFIQQKNISKYPLMAKYGIHWSQYGATIVTDSILKTIELKRNIDIPNTYWKKPPKIEKAKDVDIDIANGMNLLFTLKSEMMAYPEVLFEDTIGKTKPSVLVIADSFYWQTYNMGISSIFNRSDYWYYNYLAFSHQYDQSKDMKDVDRFDEINKHDVIIVMSTDASLPEFGWLFFEMMFDHYKGTSIGSQASK